LLIKAEISQEVKQATSKEWKNGEKLLKFLKEEDK
jgi:hypothetical protein